MKNHPYRSDGCTYAEDGSVCGQDINSPAHSSIPDEEATEVEATEPEDEGVKISER